MQIRFGPNVVSQKDVAKRVVAAMVAAEEWIYDPKKHKQLLEIAAKYAGIDDTSRARRVDVLRGQADLA